MEKDNLVKIFFKWTDPDRGLMSESVWAESLSSDKFRINNVPFFAYGISYNDIVSAKIKENIFIFDELVKRGGHSTLRVFFSSEDNSMQEELFTELNTLGATVERATGQLVAIDIPPSINLQPIIELLKDGESKGVWNYEEGYIANE